MNEHFLKPNFTESCRSYTREQRSFREYSGRLCNSLLCVAIFLGLAGCGPKSDLLPVNGSITLDGASLKSGSIRFTLTGSEKTFTAAAPIKEGQYSLPQIKGLLPGTYHIMISAVDENSPMVTIRDASGKPLTTAPAELIPAEFNTESTKTVNVTSDGENQFNFDILSKH
jgi:hypothetical protein